MEKELAFPQSVPLAAALHLMPPKGKDVGEGGLWRG